MLIVDMVESLEKGAGSKGGSRSVGAVVKALAFASDGEVDRRGSEEREVWVSLSTTT